MVLEKTSIQKLQTTFDEKNWQHLFLSHTQYLHDRRRATTDGIAQLFSQENLIYSSSTHQISKFHSKGEICTSFIGFS